MLSRQTAAMTDRVIYEPHLEFSLKRDIPKGSNQDCSALNVSDQRSLLQLENCSNILYSSSNKPKP